MQAIGMLRASRKRLPIPVIAKSTRWLRAESDGILRTVVTLGEKVTEGQVLAYISAPLGHSEIELRANKGGIVIGQQTLPLVNEGDAVFHLAYFEEEDHQVESVVEEFIEEIIVADLDPLTTGQINTPAN
jgi:predicted deacylase